MCATDCRYWQMAWAQRSLISLLAAVVRPVKKDTFTAARYDNPRRTQTQKLLLLRLRQDLKESWMRPNNSKIYKSRPAKSEAFLHIIDY